MTPGRILHVASSLGLYGAERVVLNILRDVAPGGAEVALFEKASGAHERFAAELDELGVPVHLLPDGLADALAAVRRLRRVGAERRVSVVHSHGYKPNVLASLACLGEGAPRLICSEHGFTDKSRKSRLYGRLDRQAVRLPSVHAIACASGGVLERCRAAGAPPSKLTRVVNAVPTTGAVPPSLDARDLDLVFLGRLSREKGADVLLDALRAVRGRRLRVVIAGTGDLLPDLTEAATGLEHDLAFAGYCEDPHALLARARWLVLPSLTEGMPLSLLEAFGVGTPVVATLVGDVPSAFEAARPGVPVGRPGDAASLARAIEEAVGLNEHGWAAAQAEALRLSTERFSYARWVREWRTVYGLVEAQEAA